MRCTVHFIVFKIKLARKVHRAQVETRGAFSEVDWKAHNPAIQCIN